MNIEIGLTNELTNTRYAPLAALSALYQENHTLRPLDKVEIPMKVRDFRTSDKLTQVFLSILAGCTTLSEVNTKLRSEMALATVWSWERIADQSSLSRTLDKLTQMNIEQLRHSTASIYCPYSRAQTHDWRRFLWLDFDLTGLPCSAKAEASQKGYFAAKKTPADASWHGSAPLNIGKRSGQSCFRAIVTPSSASNQPCWRRKVL
jgi:hypothetical protein